MVNKTKKTTNKATNKTTGAKNSKTTKKVTETLSSQHNNNRHFIDINSISSHDMHSIIDLASDIKKNPNKYNLALAGKSLMMIFEKPSTRTRVSFEVAINQLGGFAIITNKNDMQLGKGETIADTAKVLSRYVDCVMIRANNHNTIIEMGSNSTIPVINGLSDFSHPCQIMASLLTIKEKTGKIAGKKLAWCGDQNNVLNSYIHAAKIFDYSIAIASPEEFDFCKKEIAKARKQGATISLYHNAKTAVKDADVVITDTWVSMGEDAEYNDAARQRKINLLTPFQVDEKLMKLAKKNALFSHCLPVFRDFEATAKVVDSPNSIIFDEAENRLHIQKAILIWCLQSK
jgi:ornithine carbamoyltransferase